MGRVLRIISAAGLVGIGALLGYSARPSKRIRPKITIETALYENRAIELDTAVFEECPQAVRIEGDNPVDYTIGLYWGVNGNDEWASYTKRKDGVVVTPLFDPSYSSRDYKIVLRKICRAIMNDTSHWAEDVAQQQSPGLALHTDTVPEPVQSGGSSLQPIVPKRGKPDWFELNKPKESAPQP